MLNEPLPQQREEPRGLSSAASADADEEFHSVHLAGACLPSPNGGSTRRCVGCGDIVLRRLLQHELEVATVRWQEAWRSDLHAQTESLVARLGHRAESARERSVRVYSGPVEEMVAGKPNMMDAASIDSFRAHDAAPIVWTSSVPPSPTERRGTRGGRLAPGDVAAGTHAGSSAAGRLAFVGKRLSGASASSLRSNSKGEESDTECVNGGRPSSMSAAFSILPGAVASSPLPSCFVAPPTDTPAELAAFASHTEATPQSSRRLSTGSHAESRAGRRRQSIRASLTLLTPVHETWLQRFQERSREAREQALQEFSSRRAGGLLSECLLNVRLKVLLFVENVYFDVLISSCVIFNAIVIGVQSDYMVRNVNKATPSAFRTAELVFGILFTVELLLRFFVYGLRFWCRPDWQWNLFDTVVVCMQWSEDVFLLAGFESTGKGNNFSFIRIMRVLRLVRIMRLVRLFRFVQELRTMVLSIASSMKSLLWTLVLILLMMYVLGVYITQLIADIGLEDPTIIEEADLFKYYGSLPRAVLSLYQAMTGGVDWNDLLQPLEVRISPWLAVLFALYIAFAVLAMMNVVTGVFVESALTNAKREHEEEVMNQVRHIFSVADIDGSGTISWEEFCQTLAEPDMGKYFDALGIDCEEARGLFLLLDTDGSGTIDCEEFVQGCVRLRGPARAIDLSTLMYFNKRMAAWWKEKVQSMEISLCCLNEILDEYTGRAHPAQKVADDVAEDLVASLLSGSVEAAITGTESDPCDAFEGGTSSRAARHAQGAGSTTSPRSTAAERVSWSTRRVNLEDKLRAQVESDVEPPMATWADIKSAGRRLASKGHLGCRSDELDDDDDGASPRIRGR